MGEDSLGHGTVTPARTRPMGNIPLMPEDLETRTVMTPRTGTKICILIGLAFIVAAVYFYFVPVTTVRTTTGSVFGCGTAANPANSTFAHGTCSRVTDVEKYRAIASAAIAVLTIVLGAVMFGVDRRTETRPARRTDGYADDRPRSGDRPRWNDDPRNRYNDGRERHDRDDDERDRARDDRPVDERADRPRNDRGLAGRGLDDRGLDDRQSERPGDRPAERDADARDLDDENVPSRRERRRPRSDWDD